MSDQKIDVVGLSADIVAAYLSNNHLPRSELPSLIATTHAALTALGQAAPVVEKKLVPAVPIKKSITPDAIICLEDGKAFKTLRRHLKTKYGMTPEQYRMKWGLPDDYPMVAPDYAEARSKLAKTTGLGRSLGRGARKDLKGRRRAA
ncbi:MucR family transcriptional regulator [Bosea sp. BK604]|uniref:MucR family transcriptional regulator n=1 Tax=Bosea sp. BK604 TaxID=2512180 RepID=UPI00104A5A0F|nr:MucR family transcriptional regulator [Bosea sp. BK604]TCR66444.1 MucR family transcriptional regulator [Bosea sp. BK604]